MDCQDWLVHAATIQCSHTFCWSCIDQWLQTKQFVCPVCRKEAPPSLTMSDHLQQILNDIKQTISGDLLKHQRW